MLVLGAKATKYMDTEIVILKITITDNENTITDTDT